MWKITYNLILILVLPLFLIYAGSKKKIRRNLRERLLPSGPGPDAKGSILVHGASVGEAIIAENLIKFMSKTGPAKKWTITTNTYYTKDLLAKRAASNVHVEALPFDLLFSVKMFLRKHKPSALIIVETEIWPNLIWQAKKMGLPVIIVNGRISDSTFKNYQRFRFFLTRVFSHVDLVLAQSQEHAQRFVAIGMGPERVITTGNIKYFKDLAPVVAERQKAVVFGSIKEKELEPVYNAVHEVKKAFPDHLIYIAPRELHLAGIIEKDLSTSFAVARYSVSGDKPPSGTDIVVVDTVGDLLHIYSLCTVAFVGGSLAPYGGQNILEPMFFATPVIFGPHMENFREITQKVLDYKAGIPVKDGDELKAVMIELLTNEAKREMMGRQGRLISDEQNRVMEETVSHIVDILRGNKE